MRRGSSFNANHSLTAFSFYVSCSIRRGLKGLGQVVKETPKLPAETHKNETIPYPFYCYFAFNNVIIRVSHENDAIKTLKHYYLRITTGICITHPLPLSISVRKDDFSLMMTWKGGHRKGGIASSHFGILYGSFRNISKGGSLIRARGAIPLSVIWPIKVYVTAL